MKRLNVESERGAYSVISETGAITRLSEVLAREGLTPPRSVVSDTTVGPLWGQRAARSLEVPLIELADGEEHKRWATVEGLVERWLEAGLHRGDAAAAVGGGVLTDTVGFSAAVFLRGIDWIAVPTTLLAMVDASVGGKTGVNLSQGKNLVGAFWPPRLVVIDVGSLETLPPRELRAGLAEVVKTAWIGDRGLLEIIPSAYDEQHIETWKHVVMRCVEVKAAIVGEDEHETGRRAALNLGHTLGHALEAATAYRRFLHGEAVAWGMLAAARLARRHDVLSQEGSEVLEHALASLGPLPPITALDPDALRPHIGRDKKRDSSGVGWVLPTDDGVVLGQKVDSDEALEVFRELQEEF